MRIIANAIMMIIAVIAIVTLAMYFPSVDSFRFYLSLGAIVLVAIMFISD